ncbi:hypothetical protein PILCRDRAFT_828003 [Piloderma croceum F 1598]|uniref:Uncharacterized protein n=1 Tax=Piloderma croceum (strain F 1598) TaxID=765440 RepID=A0A0C3BBH9_PILCF|nr:hypothetical protein PILCRDRAFT_828003 [Piloderma croceum F 1598]
MRARKYVAIYYRRQSEDTTSSVERHNRKYSVKNLGFANFAGCDTRAEKGDNLRGRVRNQQWIIKETRIKGQFTISPTDADLFWGLSDAKFDTPVGLLPPCGLSEFYTSQITLVATANDTKNQWVFTKASA